MVCVLPSAAEWYVNVHSPAAVSKRGVAPTRATSAWTSVYSSGVASSSVPPLPGQSKPYSGAPRIHFYFCGRDAT